MKKLSLLFVLVALIAGAAFYWLHSSQQEEVIILDKGAITAEIERANYCQTDTDCKVAGFNCPFGCWSYVNKSEIDKLLDMTKKWQQYSSDYNCDYSCSYLTEAELNPACVENKCAPRAE
jgi:hypothetical protein